MEPLNEKSTDSLICSTLEAKLLEAGRSVNMSPDLKLKTLTALGIGTVGLSAAAAGSTAAGGNTAASSAAASGTVGAFTSVGLKSATVWKAGIFATICLAGGVALVNQQTDSSPSTEQSQTDTGAHLAGEQVLVQPVGIQPAKSVMVQPASQAQGIANLIVPSAEPSSADGSGDQLQDSAQEQQKNPAKLQIGIVSPVSSRPQRISSLKEELSQLAQVEKALNRKDATSALTLLSSYLAKFPRPQLGLEAEVLRIQALYLSGAVNAAQKRARHFLETHPTSPLRARAMQYIN